MALRKAKIAYNFGLSECNRAKLQLFNRNLSVHFSRQAGHRFGEHLDKIMPHVIKYCREEDDELREYCLQAFESFVRRCPKEISPFVSEVCPCMLLAHMCRKKFSFFSIS